MASKLKARPMKKRNLHCFLYAVLLLLILAANFHHTIADTALHPMDDKKVANEP